MQRIPEKNFQNPVPQNTRSRHRNCEKKEQTESQRKVVRLHQTNFSLGLYRILKHRSYWEEEKILRKHTPRTHAISRFMEGVSAKKFKTKRERKLQSSDCKRIPVGDDLRRRTKKLGLAGRLTETVGVSHRANEQTSSLLCANVTEKALQWLKSGVSGWISTNAFLLSDELGLCFREGEVDFLHLLLFVCGRERRRLANFRASRISRSSGWCSSWAALQIDGVCCYSFFRMFFFSFFFFLNVVPWIVEGRQIGEEKDGAKPYLIILF